jgi:hypothetical protein
MPVNGYGNFESLSRKEMNDEVELKKIKAMGCL